MGIREGRHAAVGAPPGGGPKPIRDALEALATSRGFVNEKGVNIGPVAQPLRVAIAGVPVTPPLGETLAVLGRESTLARIDRCLRECGA